MSTQVFTHFYRVFTDILQDKTSRVQGTKMKMKGNVGGGGEGRKEKVGGGNFIQSRQRKKVWFYLAAGFSTNT